MFSKEVHNQKIHTWTIRATIMLATIIAGCSDSADSGRKVAGTVKDTNGNNYPNTTIRLSDGAKTIETATNASGTFEFNAVDAGHYDISIAAPLSTTLVAPIPTTVEVKEDMASTVDFVIQPTALAPHVVIEDADIFNEIKNVDGGIPVMPGELIYAQNVFDAPFGLLTAIKAPDDHHVTLMEWKNALGNVTVNCSGNSSSVNVSLQNLIPNGTYTLWCDFLNKKKSVGEFVNFGVDLDRIEPLGSGTENIAIADVNGTINTTFSHGSCILTETPGLVIAVIYHINGNTFGSEHIPDAEEVNHMLVYFQ
jgi:hypothetical protein